MQSVAARPCSGARVSQPQASRAAARPIVATHIASSTSESLWGGPRRQHRLHAAAASGTVRRHAGIAVAAAGSAAAAGRPKRVVITGGSKGLGFALAAEFLQAGDCVAICGRNAERLDAAVAALGARFGADRIQGMASRLQLARRHAGECSGRRQSLCFVLHSGRDAEVSSCCPPPPPPPTHPPTPPAPPLPALAPLRRRLPTLCPSASVAATFGSTTQVRRRRPAAAWRGFGALLAALHASAGAVPQHSPRLLACRRGDCQAAAGGCGAGGGGARRGVQCFGESAWLPASAAPDAGAAGGRGCPAAVSHIQLRLQPLGRKGALGSVGVGGGRTGATAAAAPPLLPPLPPGRHPRPCFRCHPAPGRQFTKSAVTHKATKRVLTQLVESLADELREAGITSVGSAQPVARSAAAGRGRAQPPWASDVTAHVYVHMRSAAAPLPVRLSDTTAPPAPLCRHATNGPAAQRLHPRRPPLLQCPGRGTGDGGGSAGATGGPAARRCAHARGAAEAARQAPAVAPAGLRGRASYRQPSTGPPISACVRRSVGCAAAARALTI